MLRSFKPAYQLFNFFKKKQLAYNLPLYEKYKVSKKYFSSVSSKDFKHLDSPSNTYDILNTRDYLPKNPLFLRLDTRYQRSLFSWSDNGYAILKGFLTEGQVGLVNKEIDKMVEENKAKNSEKRIMFAFHQSKLIAKIGEGEQLKSILEMLMDKPVDLFQSINFINPSQQPTHSDSIHMTTFPYGNIIAVWIALEDVSEENGPLHYYPGSHKLPYIMNGDFNNEGSKLFLGRPGNKGYEEKVKEVIKAEGLKKEVFLAKKGDLLIWHANLLHGGEPLVKKELTRKSMVFHYYSRDAICFHEITQRPTLKRSMNGQQ